jgi:hypothetical protein
VGFSLASGMLTGETWLGSTAKRVSQSQRLIGFDKAA